MKARSIVPLALLLTTLVAAPAAAFEWQPVQTLTPVRGYPEPRVAIDASGKSTVVSAGGYSGRSLGTTAKLYVRAPGARSTFFEPGYPLGRTAPAVAGNPAGALAIATVDGSQLDLTLYSAPGPSPTSPSDHPRPVKVALEVAGLEIRPPQVEVDGSGVATVVWVSATGAGAWTPDFRPSRVHAATVSPSGTVAAVELGQPGRECAPRLDVNLRGDAVVATNCLDSRGEVFYRPAGASFGGPETISGFFSYRADVTIDGAGGVLAIDAADRSSEPKNRDYQVYEFVRPPGGSFGNARRLPIPVSAAWLEVETQEDGRTFAVWTEGTKVRRAIRAPDGRLGPTIQVPGAIDAQPSGLVSAPSGFGLVWWIETTTLDGPGGSYGPGTRSRVMAAVLGADGTVEAGAPLGVPGPPGAVYTPAFAVNEHGRAIGSWEQQCAGGGFAVMVAVRDDRRRDRLDPPCQDARAPTVAVRPRHARLVGRRLRVRVGCDEACTLGVRVRVLRGGRGRPLATGRLRSAKVGAGRYRTIAVPLRARQAAAVQRALSRGSRVATRLAIPVSDAYGNGAVRRIAVPVRR